MEITQYHEKIGPLLSLAISSYPNLPYHNSVHALDVWSRVQEYCKMAGLSLFESTCLEATALIHDKIVILGRKDNEERTAEFSREYLPSIGYCSKEIELIYPLILVTKVPTNPKNFLEEIICDADVDNFGRNDFFEKAVLVREEILMAGKSFKDDEWDFNLFNLLEKHTYYTWMARECRNDGLNKNRNLLKKKIDDYIALARL